MKFPDAVRTCSPMMSKSGDKSETSFYNPFFNPRFAVKRRTLDFRQCVRLVNLPNANFIGHKSTFFLNWRKDRGD